MLFGAVARWIAGLGQVELGLGEADVLERVGGRGRHDERLRVGHADVLAGEDDHPPGDEPGVLAGLQHAAEPVDGGVADRVPRIDLMNALITS